jgi:chemotaxis protein CheX
MKSEHINPCIEACVDTYKTMLGVTPVRNGKLEVKTGIFPVSDVMGVIGLTGKVRGAMMIGMEEIMSCKTVGMFLEKDITEVDADVLDGIGEILNIIAGAAAAKLANFKIGLGLPTVLAGKEHKMFADLNSPWIIIPMKVEGAGNFQLAITMEEV